MPDSGNEFMYVPLFPLHIMPLPGELVPLHIFEPRYRQLLADIEHSGIEFGILAADEANTERYGILVQLEQVVRRHSGGSSDIIVRGGRIFAVQELNMFYPGKRYPGGRVELLARQEILPDVSLMKLFEQFQQRRKHHQRSGVVTLDEMAVALRLDLPNRLRFLRATPGSQKMFIRDRILLEMKLADLSEKSKHVFHLN